ncbi:MAG: DUF2891 domain-containing protein, partial [Thermoanaerobaculia bacterium]
MRVAIGIGVGALAAALAASSAFSAELDTATAQRFARLALTCTDKEFPNKPEHVLESAADAKTPKDLHPSFYGCYDWHSSVHGHWMLARLLKVHPGLPAAQEIRARLSAALSAEAVAAEVKYMEAKSNRGFERPYGWAWALRLATELNGWDDPDARVWRSNVEPLEKAIVSRFQEYLPKLTRPVRTGVHPNTAFALAEAIDYARATGKRDFEKTLASRSHFYFGSDTACPLGYEPSGEDFFSPCLEEADLMRRVLPPAAYGKWLKKFLPGLSPPKLPTKKAFSLAPAVVADPTDPRLVHLDGLNLTRAWTMKGIAAALPARDPRRALLLKAAEEHARAGLARVSSGNYEGEHWLASFAVYLLTHTGAAA